MSSNATSDVRQIKRIPMACTICRQRKLKCRPSGIDERCRRCVENGGLCQFIPVNPASTSNFSIYHPQSQGYPDPLTGHTSADYHVDLQADINRTNTTYLQQNSYWPSVDNPGANNALFTQQNSYGRLGVDSYPSQGLYPQGPTIQYTYPDTATQPIQYGQVSQDANPNVTDTAHAAGYYSSTAYMAQYGPVQQTYPTNWAESTFTNGYQSNEASADSVNNYYCSHYDNSTSDPSAASAPDGV